MSEFFHTVVSSISSLTDLDVVLYWTLTLAVVMVGECYFVRFGTRSQRFYKRLFDRLHWLIAFGPFALCFALAYELDRRSGEATAIVFGFLSFFGTVHLLERYHQIVWKWLSRPQAEEQE